MFFFYDWTWILLIPALILSIYAQAKVSSTYDRYSRVVSRAGYTGAELAQEILRRAGTYTPSLNDVEIEVIPGHLTDHYDPKNKVLRLSKDNFYGRSVASLGIVAHEVGHAIQHARAYAPLHLRNAIVPAANIGSQLAFPLFFLGFLFNSPSLMDIGILAFSLALLFQVITLPVEFDASARAVRILRSGNYMAEDELSMVKKVLTAAALTYIAATAMALLQLVRLLILRDRSD